MVRNGGETFFIPSLSVLKLLGRDGGGNIATAQIRGAIKYNEIQSNALIVTVAAQICYNLSRPNTLGLARVYGCRSAKKPAFSLVAISTVFEDTYTYM